MGSNKKDMRTKSPSMDESIKKKGESLSLSDHCLGAGSLEAISDEKLKEVQEWAELSASELDVLREERCDPNHEDALLEDDEAEKEQKAKRRAQKWLRKYLVQHEETKKEVFKSRMVDVERIHDTVTFAMWYLDQGRHDFGDVGLDWIGGLIQEIQRLQTLREMESAHLIMIRACQLCMIVVSKMCEQGLQEQVQPLEDFLRMAAFSEHAHFASRDPPEGKSFSRGYRQSLFAVLNNLACLEIERGKQTEAREIIRKAAGLVRDDDPDAETFLLNAASLLALEQVQGEAESVMLKSLQIAQKRLDSKQSEIQEFRIHHEEVVYLFHPHTCPLPLLVVAGVHMCLQQPDKSLAQLRAQALAGCTDEYMFHKPPKPGQVFYVRVQEEDVKYYQTSQTALEKALEESQKDLVRIQATMAPLHLPIMRCCRKLGNLYRRYLPFLPCMQGCYVCTCVYLKVHAPVCMCVITHTHTHTHELAPYYRALVS
jgi:hypothetical protein